MDIRRKSLSLQNDNDLDRNAFCFEGINMELLYDDALNS